jgi:hypothetical protein
MRSSWLVRGVVVNESYPLCEERSTLCQFMLAPSLPIDTTNLPIETHGQTWLKNVGSLREAIAFLMNEVPMIQWEQAADSFFPNSDVDGMLNAGR